VFKSIGSANLVHRASVKTSGCSSMGGGGGVLAKQRATKNHYYISAISFHKFALSYKTGISIPLILKTFSGQNIASKPTSL
jgi:hypothetical protein